MEKAARIIRDAARHAQDDALPAFAGNVTYNAFLAIFPFLLFLVSLLKGIHATGLITQLTATLTRSLPAPAAQLVRHQILPDVMSRLTDSPILSVFLALGSLWAVSFVGRAVVQAVNRMYDVTDRRPWWQRILIPLLFSLGAAVLFAAALALIVLGSAVVVGVGRLLGNESVGWWVWLVVRWPLLVVLTFLGFALIYYCAPDLEQRVPFVSIGAALATVAWLIFSAVFALVLNNFAQFLISPLYGWFTGLIILLMYLYWSSVILLAGAEINRTLDEVRGA
jgi:membrane protein